MWSSWTESAKSSLTQALEKTGDVISRAATDAGKGARKQKTPGSSNEPQPTIVTIPGLSSETGTTSKSSGEDEIASTEQQQQQQSESGKSPLSRFTGVGGISTSSSNESSELFKSLSLGWNAVVETTKASVKAAETKVKEQQQFIQQQLNKARVAYYKRDPNLPLDVEALKDAEVVYITDRLITMGHPAMASQVDLEITSERKLAAVGHLLNRRHDGRYMVWNISEVQYDIDILDDQVLTFSFPGSPSPPLGLLLKLLVSMESWLKADDRNVAVVHCLTGKGRTSTVLAAFLCWMGEAGFNDIYQALEYIAACKQISAEELTIPSQRRYCSYFKNMLDGVHPSQPPLMLRRIIMSEAPTFAKGPSRKKAAGTEETQQLTKEQEEEATRQLMGCVPYIQVFKAGSLLHTAPATLNYQENENELPFCTVADGSISFHINLIVQGDILIRARHLTANKKRISMFRAAFHTGYVPPKVMRLTKSQLDGACIDERFSPDFFLDLIFEPADAEEASKLLQQNEDETTGVDGKAVPAVEAKGSAAAASLMGGGNLVTASAYDTMLHRDSRFWDVINARKALHDGKQQDEKASDPMVGPTIGRRRAFDGKTVVTPDVAAQADAAKGALETFSIGGEFDFLPEVIQPESQGDSKRPLPTTSATTAATGGKKQDSLMEALMGALADDTDEAQMTPDHEVVIFESHPESHSFMPTAPILADPKDATTTDIKDTTTTDSNPPQSTDSQTIEASSVKPPSQVPAGESKETAPAKTTENANLSDDEFGDLLGAADGDDAALNDEDLLNLDIDDAELEDLENFLNKA